MAKSRTEIDKESMYRKIMPSASRVGKSTSGNGPENAGVNAGGSAPAPIAAKSAGLQLPESQDMILVNLMEELVLSRLDSTLMRFNCCKCNKCKKDIAALTLNKLAPRYVVMKSGDKDKRAQAEAEYGSAVTGALVQAIMLVKKEPRH